MENALTRKLELFGALPADDQRLLDELAASTRSVRRGRRLIEEGDTPSDVHLVLEGLACRYKILQNGARQIFAYLIPGDFSDLHVFILKEMDHSIQALTDCVVVDISRARILELSQRPGIARALWWTTLVDEAILREWIVGLGQRRAEQRIAHFFCEMHARLKSVGLADDGSFELPITQAELGDTMGLSSVHINRSLQSLRSSKSIVVGGRHITILDIVALRQFSGFNPNYLHLGGGKHDAVPIR